MILFIDASALVSVIADEADGAALARRIRDADAVLWSALSCWETISGLRHSYRYEAHVARRQTELYAAARPFRLVSIGEDERRIALDAYQKYGKGAGHPARLNMGDCFAYACARTNGAALLYKGDDFVHTDLA